MGLASSGTTTNDYKVAGSYASLRNMILTMKPDAVGLKPGTGKVWGILMETGYPDAVVTLVALADGTVSIYYSNGGGIIGLSPHPGPQKAGEAFLLLAQKYSEVGMVTKDFPLPGLSYTRFYFLMGGSTLTVEVKEDDLGYDRHVLSPLFYKGHDLISEIRAVDQQRITDQ